MAHPATLAQVLPTHVAQRLRRLVWAGQPTVDRDGHGYLTIACEPPHVTWTGLDTVDLTLYDTGNPDQAPRQFRLTVEAIDDLPYHVADDDAQPATLQAYIVRGNEGRVSHHFPVGTVVYPSDEPEVFSQFRATADVEDIGYYSTKPSHLRGVNWLSQFVCDCDVEPIDEVDDSGLPDGTCTCGHDDCGAC